MESRGIWAEFVRPTSSAIPFTFQSSFEVIWDRSRTDKIRNNETIAMVGTKMLVECLQLRAGLFD